VAREYGDRVQFAVEDFGASPLADRFGVDKYPAVFVDDVLAARPEDFYAWGGPGNGRYVPWTNIDNRHKFQADLRKMLDIRLAGGNVAPTATKRSNAAALPPLPNVKLVDLAGKPFTFADYKGKPLIVEFWATWCPPCLSTLEWLKGVDPKSANVVGMAVESERKNIDAVLARYQPRGRYVQATPETLQAFGGVPAIPTLLVVDGKGRIVRTFYGAPPDLHEQILKELAKLN